MMKICPLKPDTGCHECIALIKDLHIKLLQEAPPNMFVDASARYRSIVDPITREGKDCYWRFLFTVFEDDLGPVATRWVHIEPSLLHDAREGVILSQLKRVMGDTNLMKVTVDLKETE